MIIMDLLRWLRCYSDHGDGENKIKCVSMYWFISNKIFQEIPTLTIFWGCFLLASFMVFIGKTNVCNVTLNNHQNISVLTFCSECSCNCFKFKNLCCCCRRHYWLIEELNKIRLFWKYFYMLFDHDHESGSK